MTIAEFEHLLEVYGADRTRWPLTARAATVTLMASDKHARALFAEAGALDAVLGHAASTGSPNLSDLSARIVAKRGPQIAIAAKAAAPGRPDAQHAPRAGFRGNRDVVRGAALLAASLIVGVFVGQSQFGAQAVPALEAMTGIVLPADHSPVLDLHLDVADED